MGCSGDYLVAVSVSRSPPWAPWAAQASVQARAWAPLPWVEAEPRVRPELLHGEPELERRAELEQDALPELEPELRRAVQDALPELRRVELERVPTWSAAQGWVRDVPPGLRRAAPDALLGLRRAELEPVLRRAVQDARLGLRHAEQGRVLRRAVQDALLGLRRAARDVPPGLRRAEQGRVSTWRAALASR